MPNNDTTDVEGPPEGGISPGPGEVTATPEGAAPGTVPSAPSATLEGGPPTPAEGLSQPSARGGFMEIPNWLGGPQGPLGQIMGGMAGMGGQAQSPGEQIHQRHGGFLTGLAGVLIEGLASGMAPNAQMAYQIPMQIQQQRMQQQQLQMQQQKMQEEMREAPLRENMMWAQTMVQMQALRHMAANESMENQLGLTDAQNEIAQTAIKNHAFTVIGEAGNLQDITGPNGALEDARRRDPQHALDYQPIAQHQDPKSGIVDKAAVIRIEPDAMTGEDQTSTIPWRNPIDNKIYNVEATLPGHMPYKQALGAWSAQLEQGLKNIGAEAKGLNKPGSAYNPQTQEWVAVSSGEQAAAMGLDPNTFQASTPTTFEKWKTATRQFGDVQQNISAYRMAAQNYATQVSPTQQKQDAINLANIQRETKLFGELKIGDIGELQIPGYSSWTEMTDNVLKAQSYSALSNQGKVLVDSWTRALAAMPAYQRALTESARGFGGREIMQMEMRNIPNLFYDMRDIDAKLSRFERNIDQATQGIPRIPGMDTVRDVRQKFGPTQTMIPGAGEARPTGVGEPRGDRTGAGAANDPLDIRGGGGIPQFRVPPLMNAPQ